MCQAPYLLTILLNLSILICAQGQIVVNKEYPEDGLILLSDQISIPKINSGYTLWLPEDRTAKGLIVFTHSRRDTSNTDQFIAYSLKKDLAVAYITTENRLEFLFDHENMAEIEGYIHEIQSEYKIPSENLFYCGMSLEGTRALKLAIFAQSDENKYKLTPKALAICDAPLDMVRFHKATEKAKFLQFNPITANEGEWVTSYLENNLGGKPSENLSEYVKYSPYCYIAHQGGNAFHFNNIAIRAYHEPDVNWWIETRRKDYYSMNSVDLAGLINQLKINGNENAHLITTKDKGFRPDGRSHPHSWSIVDEKELIDWFLSLL